jgi:hypothetical protein
MRIAIAVLAAALLVGCGDASAPAAPPSNITDTPASGPVQPAAAWERVSSGEGEALRLQAGAELVASLVCRTDGSGLHAATDRFKPVMSEERFTIGAGNEAFTLVANLAANRAQGVEASGEIPPGFIERVETGQPVSFNYGACRDMIR